jgi:cellulose biosynthesis protein BcsQ
VSISFITAICSHEEEDRIIATLTHQGYQLKFRAFSSEDLAEYLVKLDSDQRTLVVASDDFSMKNIANTFRSNHNLKFLTLSRKALNSEEQALSLVHQALRKTENSYKSRLEILKAPDWIAITGSSGSPGITTIALNVASELSTFRENLLIDADMRHQDLHIRLGARREGKTTLTPSLTFTGIVSEDDHSLLEINKNEHCLIDIGQMPVIHDDLLIDRRLDSRMALEVLLQSSRIVYVTQLNNRSLVELERFLRFVQRELCEVQLAVVLNKICNTDRQKSLYKSFKNQISDYPLFITPRDHSLIDRAEGRFAVLSEVGARSSLRKAVQELSIYLNNSI